MPYPTRVPWRFRNVRRDFLFWPTLESIEINQSYPDLVTTFTCTVVDNGEGWDFEPEDEIRVFAGPAGGEATERIFGGHLKVVEETVASEFGPKQWVLTGQDYTAKLGHAIIRLRRHRRAERYGNRIRFILSYLDNAWQLAGRNLDIDEMDTIERMDMYGMTVAEALDNVANEAGLRYWIDADNVFQAVQNPAFTPPFDLDNDTPDFVSSFPFAQYALTRGTEGLANATLVEPEKRSQSRWSVAHANIANYAWGASTGRFERFISNEEIRTARGAQRTADRNTDRSKAQAYEARLIVHEPGIRAGMTVTFHEAVWDREMSMIATDVTIRAVDPHDAEGEAYLFTEVTLKSKAKRRSPAIGRTEQEETANVDDRPVIDWGTDIPPPTIDPGDPLSLSPTYYRLDWGELPGSYAGSVYTEGASFSEWATTHATYYAWSWAGYHNIPFTFSPCPFGGPGAWAGWQEREIWADAITVPAHPDDMAGIYVDVQMGAGDGNYPGATVYVRSSAPTVGRSGFAIGTALPGATTRLLIPAAQVPAEGEHLWIGIGPSWQAEYGDFGAQCGVATYANPVFSGHYGSGRIGLIGLSNADWAIYTAGSGVIGTTVEHDGEDEPYAGGNDLVDMGTEGSPTVYVSGGALHVEGEGGTGIGAVGYDEDDSQPPGVWSGAWASGAQFETDAIGSGAGHIQITSTRPGMQTVGTVHLGDTALPGISVTVGSTTVYAPVDIGTGERWAFRFDDRSGYLRGKVWLVADGEPVAWTVETPLPEDGTEDTGERFTLWVRADTGQHIIVYPITARADAASGWVREFLGIADGLTDRFYPSLRFVPATLSLDLSGVATAPIWEDGLSARTDYMPSAGMTVWANYLAAGA